MDIKERKKTELHCHLDGSLPITSMERQLGRKVLWEEVSAGIDCPNLTKYLEKFDLPLSCMQSRQGLRDSAHDFLIEAAKENVEYIEVRFAPAFSVNADMQLADVIENVLCGLKKASQECQTKYNIITCAMRNLSMEENLKMLRVSREFLGQGVCAIDLAGDENFGSNKDFYELFREANRLKMPFVMHSGETGNVDNVRMAIEFGARRIGHGIALAKDEALLKECADKGIGIEMCPTSNLQTKAVKRWEDYPLKQFLDAGAKVSINTDNRTVSDTTLTKELEKIYRTWQDEKMIETLLKNARETQLA